MPHAQDGQDRGRVVETQHEVTGCLTRSRPLGSASKPALRLVRPSSRFSALFTAVSISSMVTCLSSLQSPTHACGVGLGDGVAVTVMVLVSVTVGVGGRVAVSVAVGGGVGVGVTAGGSVWVVGGVRLVGIPLGSAVGWVGGGEPLGLPLGVAVTKFAMRFTLVACSIVAILPLSPLMANALSADQPLKSHSCPSACGAVNDPLVLGEYSRLKPPRPSARIPRSGWSTCTYGSASSGDTLTSATATAPVAW
jgi:hypothetical protein